jgi:aminomethyltransferase
VSTETVLRQTPLYDRHVAAGAKLVPFAGWEMPIQYEGIRPEHLAVRTGVGVFDVSHMGQIATRGPQAFDLVQRLVSNDLRLVPVGGAQYSVLCNESGGVIDDLFTYRLAECEFLTVTNAANHERDLEWFRAHAGGYDADVTDLAADFAMLAVQGPQARALVDKLCDGPMPPRLRMTERGLAGAAVVVCGTGYTGEDGVELLIAPGDAVTVWDALIAGGAKPVGLGARDTLRLEACFHLYGNDLSEDRDPIGAGLGWCCKEETGFIGSEAIAAARAAARADDTNGADQKLVPFVIEGPGIARQGNRVIGGGVVTSGSFSPCLERGVGMAYLPRAQAQPGTAFQIDVRGSTRDAVVSRKPLFQKG